jgi:hypothetical protein
MISLASCPYLPPVEQYLGPEVTRRHFRKDAGFYFDALRYAQSHWQHGKPAQAVLQLNKAWMADLAAGDPILKNWPPPYRALAWLLAAGRRGDRGYLGNPVRHFQHLASRMSGPRAEARAWRAWGCFHLAERVLGTAGFSRDGQQLAREGMLIPPIQQVIHQVERVGWPGEVAELRRVLELSAGLPDTHP